MKPSTKKETKLSTEKQFQKAEQIQDIDLKTQLKNAITGEELKIRTTEFLKTLKWKK